MLPEPIISIEWAFWDILRNQSQDLDYSDSNHATHRTENPWIHVLSIFIAIIQTQLLWQQTFLEINSEEPDPSLKKKK